jgi:hypothetical protein
MFERLKNMFKKQEQQVEQTSKEMLQDAIDETTSCLSYCVDDDGELYIDVNLKDLEPHTIKNLAKLLLSLSSVELYVETIETIKNGLVNQGQPDLFLLLAEEVAEYSKDIRKENEDEPCIKPSDML